MNNLKNWSFEDLFTRCVNVDDMSLEMNAKEFEALKYKINQLEKKTNMCLGVGDGTGNLFVYGDYDSIKTAQNKLLELETLRKQVGECEEVLREIAFYLGVGGYNTTNVDPNIYKEKIQWGIDNYGEIQFKIGQMKCL